MDIYRPLIKEFLSSRSKKHRKKNKLSQDEMSEQLHISTRAYSDLENGKNCFSSLSLLFFLLLLESQEVLDLLDNFRKEVVDAEREDNITTENK